jgi:hypothetical protein
MFSFLRRSAATGNAGWVSVCLYPGRIDVARVRSGGAKPVVETLESWERTTEADDVALIEFSRQGCEGDPPHSRGTRLARTAPRGIDALNVAAQTPREADRPASPSLSSL